MEDYLKKVDEYERVLSGNPDDFDANRNLGKVHYYESSDVGGSTDLLNKSETHLEKADAIKNLDSDDLNILKDVYSQLNKFDKIKGINDRLTE